VGNWYEIRRNQAVDVIAYLESTDPGSWWPGPTYRSPDETHHCVLSHIFERYGSAAMGEFEERWSTSYVIGNVNDGGHPGYLQPDPKDRCLAFLYALATGAEETTVEMMEAQWATEMTGARP
jgi:hypothetical protein